MSWLKEQNRLTHEFCRGELSHFLHITACAFAALAVIGLVLGLVRPDLCSWMIGQFVQQMEDMGIQQTDGHLSALMLLGNNLRASIACILYGFVPFLFLPALSLGVNAGLLACSRRSICKTISPCGTTSPGSCRTGFSSCPRS